MQQWITDLAHYLRGHADESVTLGQMAERVGLSPFHLQRQFKAAMGVTPRQYMESARVDKFKGRLRVDASVTDAIYEAGFGSPSRIYEKLNTHLGMTPAQYRDGGHGVTISYASTDTTIGRMMIGATDRGICFLQFADSDDELLRMLAKEYPAATVQVMPKQSKNHFGDWMKALHEYLAGTAHQLELPLDVRATAFQMKVWRYLQSIPYGSVKSYAEVAGDIGQPKAARAIARACAANRVALAIPCHRVIRGSGDLAGYKWGLERKRVLLDQERRSKASSGVFEGRR